MLIWFGDFKYQVLTMFGWVFYQIVIEFSFSQEEYLNLLFGGEICFRAYHRISVSIFRNNMRAVYFS